MSQIVSAAENTTLVLNGSVFTTFAEGDYITLAPVNPLTSRTNSANGGININTRVDGSVHDLTLRVQKGGADDILLNSWRNTAAPTVINGSMKENFIRDGVEAVDTYTLEGGSITTLPTDTKNNQDDNSMMEYVIQFRSAVRAL